MNASTGNPDVTAFFDEATNTISYVVKDPQSKHCAIIASVMDIDYAAGRIAYAHADAIVTHVQDHGLTVDWLLETHVHADHLSAAPYLQEKLGGKIGVGAKIIVVHETFGKVFNEGNARWRFGACGFPGGRCRNALRFHSESAGTARRHAVVHVPRLRAERTRYPLGNQRGG